MPWNPSFDYGFVLNSENNASHVFMLNCTRLALAIAQEAILACGLSNGSLDRPVQFDYGITLYSKVPYSAFPNLPFCNSKNEIGITTLFAETLGRAVNCLVNYLELNGYNQCFIKKESHSMPKSEVVGLSVASAIITAAILLGLCISTLIYFSRRSTHTSPTPTAASTTILLLNESDVIKDQGGDSSLASLTDPLDSEIEKDASQRITHYGTISLNPSKV